MKTTPTTYPKKDNVKKQYYVCDAEGQVLGRMASRIAIMLRGKNKPIYHPAVDTGDYVIVVNADKVKLTGNKLDQKIHYTHSNYPGGLREYKYKDLMQNKPDFVIRKAVKGMLPKNNLGRLLIRKLKVYSGPEHPHKAQQPIKIEF